MKDNTKKVFDLLKVENYDKDEVLRLLDSGEVDVREKTPDGWNMLHLAVNVGGTLEVVDRLIELGVDVKERTPGGWNVLHFAVCAGGALEVVNRLVELGVDVNERAPGCWNLLHLAVQAGGVLEVVDRLIELGVDVNEEIELVQDNRMCNVYEFYELEGRIEEINTLCGKDMYDKGVAKLLKKNLK